MASDSSPSNLGWTHDVFLSFRGEDTRYNFTDHLYNALVEKGITTFRDDKLTRGEKIAPELLNAIEKSRYSIVVFSKTYADSRWCLDELAKIMECSRKNGQIVLPIFYHVDPSDVRKQIGSFGEAFTRYEENWKNKVQSWKEALTEAGNISGWHVKDGYESKHIKDIVTIIANGISNCEPFLLEDNLVGMDSHFKKISLGLSMMSNDVRMVGICGIGGIGKTTIAGYIYNKICWEFECSSFLENVKEVYKKKGLLGLQNRLLNQILKEGNQKKNCIYQGAKVIKNSLCFRKALIVFDDVDVDVDHKVQLELLVGNHTWYGKGSIIIITTRDKECLTRLKVGYIHEVEGLNSNEALELFSRHAFQSNLPEKVFENLLHQVLHYCEGLPLALKALGSLLCGKTIGQWKGELHKLENEPQANIQNVLKISFDGLELDQKTILLDIACFFQGEGRDFASKIWEGSKLCVESNIRVLSNKGLITISNNRLHMHGLIEKMCDKIVREQHPKDPSKWSRLWNPDDIKCAFASEEGMENVETISLEYLCSLDDQKWFIAQMKKAFPKMKKLRLLRVECTILSDWHEMSLPQDFEFPPNLIYLHWESLVSLPSNFHGEKLVAINLKFSKIKELLKEEKCLAELKFLDLGDSRQLINIPEFSRMPKLEKLNLGGCVNFRNLHSFSETKCLRKLNFCGTGIRELPSSIGSLTSLETLDLSACSEFEKFPDNIFVDMRKLKKLRLSGSGITELPTSIECLEAVESLELRGCSNFEKFPEIQKNMENLRKLDLDDSGIKELSCLIGRLPRLQFLHLRNCKNLRSVPSSILQLESLHNCNLSDCSNLEIFSEIMEDMVHSKGLSLRESAITELPSRLDLSNCEDLETLPNSIGMTRFRELVVRNCPMIHKLPDSLRSMQLEVLDVSGCNLMAGAIPDDLWCLFSLEELNVRGNNIDCIPGGIIRLPWLRTLKMNNCLMLKEIPELPSSLRKIEAYGCPLLETLSSDAKHPLWSSLHNCLKSHIQDFECPTYRKDHHVQVVIPGSRGIPEWISHKSMGDEITIDLPKNWYEDNNFLGFALFWHIVPFDNRYRDFRFSPFTLDPFQLLISDGDQFGHVETIRFFPNCSLDNTFVAYPALMVVYFPRIAISSEYRSNRWNKFKVGLSSSSMPEGYSGCKEKSCGIHLIYAQDHPQQSLQRSHDDTEDHPHHKRSKHV